MISSLFFIFSTVICDLLMNIYVQNDFVFSSSVSGNASTSSLVCGLGHIDTPLQHTGTYGGVHNKYLRLCWCIEFLYWSGMDWIELS
jgi:hypothetical protein